LDELAEGLVGAWSGPENRIALVGHSWGAYLALHYASRFPQRVSGIVLVDGAFGDARTISQVSKEEFLRRAETSSNLLESLQSYRRGYARAIGFWNEDLKTALDTTVRVDRKAGKVKERTSTRVQKSILEELWNYRLTRRLPRLSKTPVLLMIAESKKGHKGLRENWKRESLSTWKRYAAGFNSVSFPNTSHYIMLQRPAEFGTALKNFIGPA